MTFQIRWPVGLAVAYFVTAALTVWLTRFNGGVAFVWLASALLTSHLVLAPRSEWRRAQIVCGVASAAATCVFGLGPVGAPFLAVVNVAEATICAVLLQRWIARPGSFESISEVWRFTIAAGVIAPLATAPFGAAVATAVTSTSFFGNALGWSAGHALGAMAFGPLVMLVARGEIARWTRNATVAERLEAVILGAFMLIVAGVVFSQTTLPLLFLPLLPALLATFRIGRIGAASAMFALIAIGVPLSLLGFGPMALIDSTMGFRTQFFQFYLAVVVLTVLPAAAELKHRRRLFAALGEGEARFRLLAENTSDLIIWSDLDTTRRYVSPAARTLLGYDPEELIGTRPLDFVHEDDRASYGEILRRLTSGSVEQTTTVQRYRRKDGCWIWVEVSFSLTRDEASSQLTGYVASLRDVTDRRNAEEALRISEERLALALDSGSDGLWDWDLKTGEVQLSNHWCSVLGYDSHELEPHIDAWSRLVHPDDVERSRQLLRDHIAGLTPTYECEYRLLTKSGAYAWMLARGKVVSSVEDRPLRIVGTHIDITRRKLAEHQIEHMALHDELTGLANRTLFQERLKLAALHAARTGHGFAVLACDLDRFKSVNDTRGHGVGDAVLRVTADRLRAALRDGDTVARLGGDEFAIILDRIEQPRDAARVAQKVIDLIGHPIDIEGKPAGIGVSVGIALGLGDPAGQIFKNADIALYLAKAAGRNTYRFFEQGMDAELEARSQLEVDLKTAVRENALTLHFQPIMNLASDRPCCFEALLRWPHPTRGMVSPSEFVPLAEETGLIVPLGAWVLREACVEAAGWPNDVSVAVNVSAMQFQTPGLEAAVAEALSVSGLPPHRLELEITESVMMQNAEGVVSSLMRLRALGVRIALDDFGTGFSSLSYLRRFPFNKIKIDRTFIAEIGDPGAAAIVSAIVGLARRMGAEITAEGVETQEQLKLVRRKGCTEAQGFLFSRALPAANIPALLDGKDASQDASQNALRRRRNARSARSASGPQRHLP